MSASPTLPAAVARPLRDLGPTVLDAGTYVLDLFPVHIVFDVPAGHPPGWNVGMATDEAAVVLWNTPPNITYGFEFWTVDNVYVDPCDGAAAELQPPVGPSVNDLVAALSNLPRFEATAPLDVTVGAFRGKEIRLTTLDSGPDCPDVIAWSTGDGSLDLDPGVSRRVQILDVDGVRITMLTPEPAQPDPAVEAELQQILDSVRTQQLP